VNAEISEALVEDLRFLGVAVTTLDRTAGYFASFIAEIINNIEDATGHTLAPSIAGTCALHRRIKAQDAT
jgi:hypothetical protein